MFVHNLRVCSLVPSRQKEPKRLSNVNMSDDERRRIRNREYQRQFREKKIRREQQRLSMATSSAYAFRP